METKVQVDQVMDDARKINQVVARGNYGADAARLWGVLRTASITLLARTDFSPWRSNRKVRSTVKGEGL